MLPEKSPVDNTENASGVARAQKYILPVAMVFFVMTLALDAGFNALARNQDFPPPSLPASMPHDEEFGDLKSSDRIIVYLADGCSHCKLWKRDEERGFEEAMFRQNIRITYRIIDTSSAEMSHYLASGVQGTPSWQYHGIYRLGAPPMILKDDPAKDKKDGAT